VVWFFAHVGPFSWGAREVNVAHSLRGRLVVVSGYGQNPDAPCSWRGKSAVGSGWALYNPYLNPRYTVLHLFLQRNRVRGCLSLAVILQWKKAKEGKGGKP